MKCSNNHEEIDFDDNIECPLCQIIYKLNDLEYSSNNTINDLEYKLRMSENKVHDLEGQIYNKEHELRNLPECVRRTPLTLAMGMNSIQFENKNIFRKKKVIF